MRHLTSIRELDRDAALAILDLADELAQVNAREVKKLPTLRGKTVVNLFYENSTRTRVSFEIAATRLSADVINISSEVSSVAKGESLKDTAQTLEALGAAGIVVRHPNSGAAKQLADMGWVQSSIINAGDGSHEHPTQALLDAMTIRQLFSTTDLAGLSVVIVGDLSHSRVARSNILLLNKLGAEVLIAGPSELVPEEMTAMGAKRFEDLDAALASRPDVVMMLRVQKERMASEFASEREYAKNWQLDSRRLNALPESSRIMHPGPMNRGLEISAEAADDPRSAILRQVTNGVSVRMAVLHTLLAADS
ncbi:MAG: aspartate carbamoyltransferase catalytic subunit [Aquiluna sp.]